MIKWILWISLAFVFSPALSEVSFSGIELTSLPTSAASPEYEGNRIIIPIKRSGNLILIEGKIDSIVGDFILDTGAPYLVLNRTYFRSYESSRTVVSAGVGASSSASRTIIDSLTFAGIRYRKVDADITNLGQLENNQRTKILGLLGTNLFVSFEMVVHLQAKQMVLYRLGNTLQRMEADTQSIDSLWIENIPRVKMKFRFCDDKIFLPVSIAGQKMNWILDTGAEANVVDAWSKKKILKEFIVSRRVQLTGAGGQQQDVLLGVMPELSVGESVFPMQQTMVTSMAELSETCSLYIDGILGYQFLSQGIFILHFGQNEFSFYLYNDLSKL